MLASVQKLPHHGKWQRPIPKLRQQVVLHWPVGVQVYEDKSEEEKSENKFAFANIKETKQYHEVRPSKSNECVSQLGAPSFCHPLSSHC